MKNQRPNVVGFWFAIAMVFALVAGVGSAAELSTAEIGATPNDVTVTQGQTATFEIWVAATGQINCGITVTSPATATVPTAFSVSSGGQTSTGTPSPPMAFYAGPPSTTSCSVRWTGYSSSFKVPAAVTAAATTPLGNYALALSAPDGTVVINSPAGLTPALNDAFPTTITVHVVQSTDSTPPVLSLPGDMTVEATGPGGAPATWVVSANDDIDGNVAVTCNPASGTTFPLGNTAVSCSASDLSGNKATKSFHVTVVDTTGPAVTVPADGHCGGDRSGRSHGHLLRKRRRSRRWFAACHLRAAERNGIPLRPDHGDVYGGR